MGRPFLDMIRTHISFDRQSLARLDALVGEKGRAAFVRRALDQALDTAEMAQQLAADQAKRPK